MREKSCSSIRLTVRVTPNAHRSECTGIVDGVFRVRLRAPPVDGKANEALIHFVADMLELPQRKVLIVSGQASRHKVIELRDSDLSAEKVAAVLAPFPP